MRTCQADQKTWVDPLRGVLTRKQFLNNGFTNLGGKSLNKGIHCSGNLLAKEL